MKKAVAGFTVVGTVAGLVLAAGAWLLRMPAPIGAFVALSVLGSLVVATHWLNWSRLHDPEQQFPRGLLFGFNLALMAFFLVAFNFTSHSVLFVVYYLVFAFPLAVNAIYLCAPIAAEWPRTLRLFAVVSVLAVLAGSPGCYYWSTREYQPTALHIAAENNDVPAIKEWIARGKSLDRGLTYPGGMESSGLRGVTALMLAAERGNEEAAAALIEGGANIYLEDEDLGPATGAVFYNRTALDYAVAGGSRRILTMLADRWRGKPLTRRGQEDVLLAWENMCRGPNLARRHTPYADGKWVAGFVLDRLLTKEEAQRALLQASEHAGCPVQISFLLERHVPPTPEMLMEAIWTNHADLVRELVAAGADVNAPLVTRMAPGVTPAQNTKMPLAAAAWSTTMTKILLDAGAEVNGQDDQGRTALHYAIEGEWRYANDYSPLLTAMEGIEYLVSRGARTDIRDKSGKTPGDHFAPNYNIIGLFRERMIAALQLPPERFPREPGDHAAVLRACFDTNGDLTGAPTIVDSSGVPGWDAAAGDMLLRGASHTRSKSSRKELGSCIDLAINFPFPSMPAGPAPDCQWRGTCARPAQPPATACVVSTSFQDMPGLSGLRCGERSR